MQQENKKLSSKKYFKRVLSLLPAAAAICFTVFFFAPLEIFLGNIIEFEFAMHNTIIYLFLTSVVLTAVLAFIEALLPKKVLQLVNVGVFALATAMFVQSQFLNGQMQSLTGDESAYPIWLLILNLFIWVVIVAGFYIGFFIAKRKKKAKPYRKGLSWIALALIVIQLAGVTASFIPASKYSLSTDNYLALDGEFTLSKNENVIYFIIDTCDSEIVNKALQQYPDMFDSLDGFTYYQNSVSHHSRTYPSIPYLLTKQTCYFDVPYPDYIANAHQTSTFLEEIKATGADTRIYTSSSYVDDSLMGVVDNYKTYDSSSILAVKPFYLIKKMLKISLYRILPYLFKDYFQYSSNEINNQVINNDKVGIYESDDIFARYVRDYGLTVDESYEKAFRFYHFWGTHSGCDLDENGNKANTINDLTAAMRGCIRIIEEYIQEMKRLGVYEQSTIIITADHGHSHSTDTTLEVPGAPTSLMLVKPAGSFGTPVKTSTSPVCHDDLFATALDGLGANGQKYGSRIFDIAEDAKRDRYYYHSAFYSDVDGEVVLREYLINGDARDENNWVLTGKYWDINYSERAVSKRRFNPDK